MSVQERRERERARRRHMIITAARELADSEGWDAVTTRRLAAHIEYSQPVLYSHFAGKSAIVRAVALTGFEDLTEHLRAAGPRTTTPRKVLCAVAAAYLEFAHSKPAVYAAMFMVSGDLEFGGTDSPQPLREAFAELYSVVAPLVVDRDPRTLTEVFWCALHGLADLSRNGRLRPDHRQARLDLLVEHFG